MSERTLFFCFYGAVCMMDVIFFLNSFQYSGFQFLLGFLFLALAHTAGKLAFAEIK